MVRHPGALIEAVEVTGPHADTAREHGPPFGWELGRCAARETPKAGAYRELPGPSFRPASEHLTSKNIAGVTRKIAYLRNSGEWAEPVLGWSL